MEANKTTAAAMLRDAKRIPERETLATHTETITTLREKNYTWREIAEFFRERGIETDHSKIFRFMQRQGRQKMTSTNDFIVPNAQDYKRALEQLKDIHPNHKEMLKCHYLAHNRTVNFTTLAKRVGYKNYRAANLHYGTLAGNIGKAISESFVFVEGEDRPFFCSAIGTENSDRLANADYELVMHHELAKAIQQLGWFES